MAENHRPILYICIRDNNECNTSKKSRNGSNMNEQLKEPVRQVITLLVAGNYAELETLTSGVRLTAKDIATAVADYGRKLLLPPEEGFGLMNVVEVKNAKPRQWLVTMPLWTREEGRSDLTVELTLIERQNSFAIELDDLHVL